MTWLRIGVSLAILALWGWGYIKGASNPDANVPDALPLALLAGAFLLGGPALAAVRKKNGNGASNGTT